jgi:SAM-dependent methyltransferase
MFYDQLAPYYHFLYENWDAAIARQSSALDQLIVARWGEVPLPVLDVAAGIGTQAIGLAGLGYLMIASDLSAVAIRRAGKEAAQRHLRFSCLAADFTNLPYRSGSAGLLLAADNSLPHLLTDEHILLALREFHRCLRPGGGLLLTLRDYGAPPPSGTVEQRPYGWRQWGAQRYFLSQEWRWDGPWYDLRITAAEAPDASPVQVFSGRYYAIQVPALIGLCQDAGFIAVERRDGTFYQPVILATRPVGA